MPDNKVLIIGAGLGGLVLAHVLQNGGVPFEIFERDTETSHRSQGWAVALVECLPLLEKLLPPALAKDLYKNSVNINTGDYDELGFADLKTGEKVGSMGGVPRGQEGHFLRVSRSGLRNYLLHAQDFHVNMGKHFTHYTEDGNSVTAFFADGSSVTGSLLIGADGVHSHVLDQLIGTSQHRPALSKYVPIFGEVDLPPHLYKPLRQLGNAVILAGAPDARMQIGMLQMSEDQQKASYFWSLMCRRESPQELSDWVHTATKSQLYEFSVQTTEGYYPLLTTELIRFGGPEAIVTPPPKFVEYVPPEDLPKGRVSVLGDAAHAMIPFRGAGANTAILDACDLGLLLQKAHQKGDDFSNVLADYHKTMIPRGKENVLSSRAAGEGGDDLVQQWAIMFRRTKPSH